MSNNKIAGGEIDWQGTKYNWGDEVPDDLVAAHPEWVHDKPLTRGEVDQMSEEELRAALIQAHQLHTPEESVGQVSGEGGVVAEVKKGGKS